MAQGALGIPFAMRGLLLGCTLVAAAHFMHDTGFSPTPLTAEYDLLAPRRDTRHGQRHGQRHDQRHDTHTAIHNTQYTIHTTQHTQHTHMIVCCVRNGLTRAVRVCVAVSM
jgi:hypothetical protein